MRVDERLKLFLWRVCGDMLRTGNNISQVLGVEDKSFCLRHEVQKTSFHLFVECNVASRIWYDPMSGL